MAGHSFSGRAGCDGLQPAGGTRQQSTPSGHRHYRLHPPGIALEPHLIPWCALYMQTWHQDFLKLGSLRCAVHADIA